MTIRTFAGTEKKSNFKLFHQETSKYILKYYKFYEHVFLNLLFETEYINLVKAYNAPSSMRSQELG